jgi:N,N'-diacetyllegionaminate synthase
MYIIAELGNTHDGSIGLAKQLIASAAESGVNAVKIQTHIFSAESLANAPSPPYFKEESREQYFTRTAFDLAQYISLKSFAEVNCGVEFLSSPFSLEAVELLEEVGMVRYKIPSGEVTNIPMLEHIAQTQKPVILSSGMSPFKDLDLAVDILQTSGCADLSLLQCSSRYPCPPEEVGLNVLSEIKSRYGVPVGYSDHTLGCAAPFAATALGAEIIEKHFTLSTRLYGSDAKHSMEPDEFKKMVSGIREISSMLKNPVDKDLAIEDLGEIKITFEKSVVAKNRIKKGDILSRENLTVKKPGNGIPANMFLEVVGKKANYDMEPDDMLSKDSYL